MKLKLFKLLKIICKFLNYLLNLMCNWVMCNENFRFSWKNVHVSKEKCTCKSEKCTSIDRLIIELSFMLTFWTWIEIESSCSHFQLNLSQIAHIFNLTWLNSTENWVNLIWLVKNLSLTSRELNIEKFSIFDFCIIF